MDKELRAQIDADLATMPRAMPDDFWPDVIRASHKLSDERFINLSVRLDGDAATNDKRVRRLRRSVWEIIEADRLKEPAVLELYGRFTDKGEGENTLWKP